MSALNRSGSAEAIWPFFVLRWSIVSTASYRAMNRRKRSFSAPLALSDSMALMPDAAVPEVAAWASTISRLSGRRRLDDHRTVMMLATVNVSVTAVSRTSYRRRNAP